jgi:hypothetical protein
MNMFTPRSIVILFTVLGSLAGCATATKFYDGPEKPASEIVKITGMSGLDPLGGFASSLICAVDDKEIEGCVTSIEILPGMHRIRTVAKSYGMEEGSRTIEHEFKPGERYLLGISIQGGLKVPSLMKDR